MLATVERGTVPPPVPSNMGACLESAVRLIFCILSFFELTRKFLHALPHDFTGFKLNRRSRGNDKAASRFVGIATHSRLGKARLKDAKIPQFDRNVFRQTIGDMIKGALHDLEDFVLHHSSLVTYGDHNIAFGEL